MKGQETGTSYRYFIKYLNENLESMQHSAGTTHLKPNSSLHGRQGKEESGCYGKERGIKAEN